MHAIKRKIDQKRIKKKGNRNRKKKK